MENIDMKLIGNRIKHLRKNLGLTQTQLADKIPSVKGKSSIANYENGTNLPSDEVKLKMCEIFDCSLDYLMCNSDKRKNEIDIDKALIGLSTQFNKLSEESQKKVKEQIELLLENEELKRKLEGK